MSAFEGVPGFGPKRHEALLAAGLSSWEDVLFRLPGEYRRYGPSVPLDELSDGQTAVVEGEIVGTPTLLRRPGGKTVVFASLQDACGRLRLVFFNRPYLRSSLRRGMRCRLYGRAEERGGALQMANPDAVPKDAGEGPAPVYPPIPGVPASLYRALVRAALQKGRPEEFPEAFLRRHALLPILQALENAHFPQTEAGLAEGLRTLSFEKFFLTQLALRERRLTRGQSVPCPADEVWTDAFLRTLPFALTGAQRRAWGEIRADLRQTTAMARLVEGDVGSGKTVLALMALAAAAHAGLQGAMMAPTELLARQHFVNAKKRLEPLGIRCGLLTGSVVGAQRRALLADLKEGRLQVLIGTHALFSEGVEYRRLGLVVADEQHRFGVRQRGALQGKGNSPHVLVMSATPIPRTLALLLYGDLDLSILDEPLPGRLPIRTHIVPESKRNGLYGFLEGQIADGKQVYVVCPLVQESEESDLLSAEESLEAYARALPDRRVGLAHGRMPQKEKQAALDAFRDGTLDVLVSTTVIEVGIDVPAATAMVVENADRFGLTQLHQLRGRVGRGGEESFCFLMGKPNERLRLMTKTNDGFRIAQEDFRLRGPGDMLGTRQHGAPMAAFLPAGQEALWLQQAAEAAKRLQDWPAGTQDALRAMAMRRYASMLGDFAFN